MATTSRRLRAGFFAFATFLGALSAACDGCHRAGKGSGVAASELGAPSVRVYFLSDLAGAIEPCGCQKNMLGGLSHFGAYVAAEKLKAPNAVVASVGPLFFMEETLAPERAEQDTWKAEALADGLKSVGLAAFTPGLNDWSAGAGTLAKLRDASGGALLAGNVGGAGAAGAVSRSTRDIGGVKVAFVGVSIPKTAKDAPRDVTIDDAAAALAREAKAARAEGARVVIGMAAMDRVEAIRAAEKAPELDVLAIGSGALAGDTNSDAKAAMFVGPVLVVQPSNHLTRASIVDFYVRGDGRFADGSGLAKQEDAARIQKEIADIDKSLAAWELRNDVDPKDLAAQKKRRAELEADRKKALEPPPPPAGSFVRYELANVTEDVGKDKGVTESLAAYYKRVNDFNAKKFAGKQPPPPAPGAPYYVGVEVCKTCHEAPYAQWQTVAHSRAYATLANESKNFNLDCVSCHVTGYEKPGGSTVTEVALLKDVQCENCHGPGSLHIDDPYSNELAKKVEETVCTQCHHEPHSSNFDYKARLERILGPGHGKPGKPSNNDPPAGWKPPAPRYAAPPAASQQAKKP